MAVALRDRALARKAVPGAGGLTRWVALLAVILACTLVASRAWADAVQRVALVIGESHYQHIPTLPNAQRDATLVAQTLQAVGFTLVGGKPYLDLSKADFEQAIRDFRTQLSPGSIGLFYYAGHGIQLDGVNYVVPVNANLSQREDADFELIDVNVVLRQMQGAGKSLHIVILDACRNNPFGGSGVRGVAGGLAQMLAPKGTLISYATEPGSVAEDGPEGGNGPYARALAQATKEPGRDLFQVFNDVGVIVDQLTKGSQRPWVSSSPIEGDFYFAGGPAPVERDAASPAEISGWEAARDSPDPDVLAAFMDQYPNGAFADRARDRLAILSTRPIAVVPFRTTRGDSRDAAWKGIFACGATPTTIAFAATDIVLTVAHGTVSGTKKYDFTVGTIHVVVTDQYRGRIEFERLRHHRRYR